MSDIDKAEELLKKFLEISDPLSFENLVDREKLRNEVKGFLNKPVIIKDWNDELVRIYVDSDKDVSFGWGDGDGTPNIVAFKPDELVRGLTEIGVIK